MVRSRTILGAVLAIATSMGLASPAAAVPVPFESLPVTCEVLGDIAIRSVGNGLSFAPAFIDGTNDLLVPYAVTVTTTVGTGSPTTESIEKAAPLPDDAITCVFDATLHFAGVEYHLTGSIVGVVMGQP